MSSLVYCGKCGARFHGEHGNYSCYSRTKGDKKYIIDPNCRNKKWKIEALDKVVIDYISRLDFSALESFRPMPVIINDHKSRLSDIDKQIEKLIDLYQVGGIPIETIQKKIESLTRERETLLHASKPKAEPRVTIAEMRGARDTLMTLSGSASLEERRACLTMIVDRVIVNDEDVDIQLKKF